MVNTGRMMSDAATEERVGRMVDGKWTSTKTDNTNRPVFKEMFALRDAMSESGFEQRAGRLARELGNKGQVDTAYWNSRAEMFARCFERHVQRKLEKEMAAPQVVRARP